MSLNLTPEEIVLLDQYAAAALAGVNASNPNITHEQAAECSLCDALAMIERRRLVLAEHAARVVEPNKWRHKPVTDDPLALALQELHAASAVKDSLTTDPTTEDSSAVAPPIAPNR